MTIRLVVLTQDAAMAANVGGNVEKRYATFDVELPELEAHLRAGKGHYSFSIIEGGFIVDEKP